MYDCSVFVGLGTRFGGNSNSILDF